MTEYLQNNVEEAVAAFNAISEEITATGVEVEEGTKPRLLANKIPQVYNKGQGDLWDDIQDYGNRTNYVSGFKRWSATAIKPKYPVNTETLYEIFEGCGKLEKLPLVTCANADGRFITAYAAFSGCTKLKSIDFDIVNSSTASSAWYSTFNYCSALKTIQKIVVLESQPFVLTTFRACTALENIVIEGTIGQNGFDIHWSTKLSADSLKSIIDALSATTTGLTVTLPTTAQSNYEAVYGTGSWATLTATKSNWTIAYT